MKKEEFSIGMTFKHVGKTYRCTDVGSRVVVAICISEVWQTRTIANTGKKEQVRVQNPGAEWFAGPPYSVTERVFDESSMVACLQSDACEHCGALHVKVAP